MRKFGVFSLFIFCSIMLAGIYGITNDQITYSICPEYFTKFKYQQFGFDPDWFGGHRQTAAVIGFFATWWMGVIIGIGLGLTALIFPDHKSMWKALRRAVIVAISFTGASAILGGLYGWFVLSKTGVNWWMPENLVDKVGFITVGSIHNFSYLGGLLGMIAGIYYLIKFNQISRSHNQMVEQTY